MINAKQIVKYRQNQSARLLQRPFTTFFDEFSQCEQAAQAIVHGSVDEKFLILLERSSVISLVSAIECYYRDVLDGMFRLCKAEFVLPKIKQIHQAKYDALDIIDFFENEVQPYELIVLAQSFQNTESIERVFSKFVETGFWKSILNLQVRERDDPENVVTWTHKDMDGLKATFDLRHELVHNPGRASFMTDEIHSDLCRAAHMIWGSDVTLMNLIGANARKKEA